MTDPVADEARRVRRRSTAMAGLAVVLDEQCGVVSTAQPWGCKLGERLTATWMPWSPTTC